MSWRKKQSEDEFFKRAKVDNYRSRASYKLLEIQQKFALITCKSTIVDLGCAPGGWLQVARKLTEGEVYGIDLQDILPIPGTHFAQMDFFDDEALDAFLPAKVEVILSDMSPKITGDHLAEHIQSIQMLHACAELASKRGAKWLVFKLVNGGRTHQSITEMRKSWHITIFKPKSSRPESREIYLVLKSSRGK